MGFRKKILGVGEFNYEILYVVGLTLRENQINAKASHHDYGEYWELWEWMVFWQLRAGSITKDEFGRLYLALGLAVKDFEYEYQRDDEEIGQRFALLYTCLLYTSDAADE